MRWLTRRTGIKANAAKAALAAFSASGAAPSLTAYYCVTGVDAVGAQAIRLVDEAGLAGARAALASVTGEHIYSLQQAPLASSDALWLSGRDVRFDPAAASAKYSQGR